LTFQLDFGNSHVDLLGQVGREIAQAGEPVEEAQGILWPIQVLRALRHQEQMVQQTERLAHDAASMQPGMGCRTSRDGNYNRQLRVRKSGSRRKDQKASWANCDKSEKTVVKPVNPGRDAIAVQSSLIVESAFSFGCGWGAASL
jgi:hypothetical protein